MRRVVFNLAAARYSVVLFALLLSVICGVAMMRPVHALSLPILDNTARQLERALLTPQQPSETSSGSASPHASSASKGVASSSSTSPSHAQPSASAGMATSSADVPSIGSTEPPLATVEPIKSLPIQSIKYQAVLTSMPVRTQASGGSLPLAVLQPSEQGWRIFNVVWYWWLLSVGAAVVCYMRFMRYRNRTLAASAK